LPPPKSTPPAPSQRVRFTKRTTQLPEPTLATQVPIHSIPTDDNAPALRVPIPTGGPTIIPPDDPITPAASTPAPTPKPAPAPAPTVAPTPAPADTPSPLLTYAQVTGPTSCRLRRQQQKRNIAKVKATPRPPTPAHSPSPPRRRSTCTRHRTPKAQIAALCERPSPWTNLHPEHWACHGTAMNPDTRRVA
jgi:hypothetical protein